MSGNVRLAALVLAVATLAGCAGTPATRADADGEGGAQALLAGDRAPASAPRRHGREAPSAEETVARAESALAAGRPEEAVYLYLAAAMLTPGSAAPLVRAGAIQESRHELGGALRAYEGALARSPDDAALVAKVGLLLAQAGRDPAAELVLRDALGRTPTDWRLLDALGRLADRRLDRAAARARYDEALKIAPRSAPVLNNRGYSRLLDGDLEGAEEDFRAALAAGPLDAARVNLGTVLARKGDYAGALERLNGPLAESEALYRVGVAALDRHERERAADYLDRATRAAPTYFEAAHVALAQAQRPDAP